MEITRNQYWMVGLVLLFLGFQFREVEIIELNAEFTQFLADRTGHPLAAVSATSQSLTQGERPPAKGRTIRPPEWFGWSLISIGGVLVLHSLAMPKPS
jgi:hypothetical protein